jgi:hypothetical protein
MAQSNLTLTVERSKRVTVEFEPEIARRSTVLMRGQRGARGRYQ